MAELQEVLEKLDLVNDVKLEIKDVISTDSLHFEDYPNLIARHLVNTPTEQTIADRVTANGATIADGIAFIKTIKGNSMKWSHPSSPLSATMEGWNQGLDTTPTIVGFADGVLTYQHNLPWRGWAFVCQPSHKYLIYYKIKNVNGSQSVRTGFSNQMTSYALTDVLTSDSVGTSWTTISHIMTSPSDAVTLILGADNTGASGYTRELKDVNVFDLTYMGMEDVTSADQFAQRLGFSSANELPSYPYDEGSIKNFSASQLVTEGTRRVVDLGTLNWAIYNGFAYATNADSLNAVTFTTAKATFPIYHVNDSNLPSITEMYIQAIDQVLRVRNIGTMSAAEVKEAMNGVMLNYASTELSTLDTLSLPSIELLSAGSARDEYNLADGKLTRRIGMIKLKDLDFSQYGADATGHSFFALLDGITGGDDNTKRNFLTREYTTMSFVEAGILDSNKKDKVICGVDNAKRVIVRDTAFSSASAFKAHFTDDDVLYYEVVTPVTTDEETSKAYYKVENGGKEMVDTTTSSPLKAEIGYQS